MIDIIIPTYKNKEGLITTLNSIKPNENITVTIVDDCSGIRYDDILEQFSALSPTIIYCEENRGPGCARQKGINSTHEPYIAFIDTGDYYLREHDFAEIAAHPDINIFSWPFLSGKDQTPSKPTNNHLHGRVYRRGFLEEYGVSFAEKGSYANEDIGFNRYCRMIAKNSFITTHITGIKSYQDNPIVVWTTDPNSLTHKNDGEFGYRRQNPGLAYNEIHVIELAREHNISKDIILEETGAVLCFMQNGVLQTAQERPEFAQEAWDGARAFYNACYTDEVIPALRLAYSQVLKKIKTRAAKKHWKQNVSFNIMRFLDDLKNYPEIPRWYI